MSLVSVIHDERASATPAQGAPEARTLYAMPEFFEFRQAILWLIAGDDAGIDGADGGADDPVGLDARLVQRLIDAALIGAKRVASLQHKNNLAVVVVVADLVNRF